MRPLRAPRVKSTCGGCVVRHVLACVVAVLTACDGSRTDREQPVIRTTDWLVLGAADDSLDLAGVAPAIATSGHVAVHLVSPPSGGVGIYESTGRLLRVIRGSGGGPGELRDVNAIGFGPGDSLWVVDGTWSPHVYRPAPTLTNVRTVHAERPISGSVTAFGILSPAVVWNTKLLPPELIGWDGKVRARFGSDRPIAESEDRMGAVLAVDSAHIWMARGNAYVLDPIHSASVDTQIRPPVDT